MSEPSPPPPDPRPAADDAAPGDAGEPPEGFDVARLLRGVAFVACLASAFFAGHGIVMTAQHLIKEIGPGVVARTEPTKGGTRVILQDGTTGSVGGDILYDTGPQIVPRPGMRIEKRGGTLTYRFDGQRRGGIAWTLRHWLLPARVTFPLAVYFVLSWLLVLRATQHRWPILVELIVLPLLKWIALTIGLLAILSAIAGCAAGCFQLLFRMSG